MTKPKIIAYLKPTCGWSQGVRAIMRKYDLPFEDRDIINDPMQRQEMIEKSGQMLSPCVVVDGHMLVDVSGEEVEARVPAAALRVFAAALAQMAEGHPVTLVPFQAELSTQQAAELMGVSRPYFVKLLEQGRIPFRKVGEQRRVRYRDLLRYLEEYQRDAAAAVSALTAEAQALGLYE